jgi:hypothetical protein
MVPYKLGCKPRAYDPRIPHWSSLRLAAPQPSPPPAHFWEHGMPRDFGMMANNAYGCCVCSAGYHSRQIWSYNANPPEDTQPDTQVLDAYEQFCGFVPSDPNTDQGCVEQDFLKDWMTVGLPLANGTRDKLLAFFELDPRNLADVRDAIWQCGVVLLGIQVPAYIMNGDTVPATWGLEPHADQTIVGGHAIVLPSYYNTGAFGLISWGSYYRMTPGFLLRFCDEAYALVDQTWIEKTGKTPLGLTAAQLEQAMAALK